MPTIVFLTLWGQQAGDISPPTSAQGVADQTHDALSATISIFVFPMPCLLNGALLQGYCIMAAVRVQRDVRALEERLALCQQAQEALVNAFGSLYSLLLVMKLNSEIEPYGLIESRC